MCHGEPGPGQQTQQWQQLDGRPHDGPGGRGRGRGRGRQGFGPHEAKATTATALESELLHAAADATAATEATAAKVATATAATAKHQLEAVHGGVAKHCLQFPPPPDYPPPTGGGSPGNTPGRRQLLPRYPDPDPDAIEICNESATLETSPHHLKQLAARHSKTLGRNLGHQQQQHHHHTGKK